jgi:hypothetical protein
LRGDIVFANSKPIRLLYEFFERDNFSTRSKSGQRWLRGLLMRLPDNKIVEDIHSKIRNATRGNANTRLTPLHIQELINTSNVLESRQVDHPTAITKDYFRAQVRSTKVRKTVWRHTAAKHKLPREWTVLMGSKTWHSPTPESALRFNAAWHWLQTWMTSRDAADDLNPPQPLGRAWFSTFAKPFTVVGTNTGEGKLYASLGNAKWGALGLPVSRFTVHDAESGDNVVYIKWESDTAVEWFHITDPEEWYVLPFAVISPATLHQTHPELGHLGIVCRVTEPAVGLLKFFFRAKTSVVHADLLKLASSLGIACASSASRHSLVEAIAAHLTRGDSEEEATAYIHTALSLDRAPKTDELQSVIQDPLCEEAYEELPDDDQFEFQDLKQGFRKQKVRNRLAAWREAQCQETANKAMKGKRKFAGRVAAKAAKVRRVSDLAASEADEGVAALVDPAAAADQAAAELVADMVELEPAAAAAELVADADTVEPEPAAA